MSEYEEAVRQGALRQLGHYPRLSFYARMFQEAGFLEAQEGALSKRMIDALVVHGNAEQIKERLRQLPALGMDELLAMPILPPGDDAPLNRTLTVLGELAME